MKTIAALFCLVSVSSAFSAAADEPSPIAVKVRGLIMADGRFFFGADEGKIADQLFLRSLRPYVQATLYDYIDARLVPDFAQGKAVLQEGWINIRPWRELQFQIGKLKPQVGLERLQTESNTLFTERGYPTSLVPNRDIGLQLYGEAWSGRLTYAAGVFIGTADGESVDLDTADAKDVVARVFVMPFKGFGVGIAGTFGKETEALDSYKSVGQSAFFKYAEGVVPAGDRWRVEGGLHYYVGPFGVLGEVAIASHELTNGTESITSRHLAWLAQVHYVIYGGDASFEGVNPTSPIALKDSGVGAFELGVRITELRLDDDVFNKVASLDSSAKLARTYGGALNWWANKNLRITADFQRTDFKGGVKGGDRTSENVFTSRVQLAF